MTSTGVEAETTSDRCCPPLLSANFDSEAADEVALILKSLADPIRLQLVSIIGTSSSGEACACDLPTLVGRSQPTVSHHLTQLVKSGVLEREQRGKWAWFRLDKQRLQSICNALSIEGC